MHRMLWFASNLLFLHYQSQHLIDSLTLLICCDLLRIYYFCTINHSFHFLLYFCCPVVICFEFIIFALSITAHHRRGKELRKLWFASNLLFLHYQSQHLLYSSSLILVVICFEFIIFALSITAMWVLGATSAALWFASNLLFLHYQSQHAVGVHMYAKRCDLLRIYYFCTINHSDSGVRLVSVVVVICFEFIIFALSITAYFARFMNTIVLWFASNLLFLHYQSQRADWTRRVSQRCDLLRIYYFCTINHS